MKRIMVLFVAFAISCAGLNAAGKKDKYPLRDTKEVSARKGLPNFFAKLKAGKNVKIGYLGGSITAQNGWRPKTLKMFQEQFPKCKIEQINAAIGGTGSDLGVFRVQHDVLRHKPDLLFVEFAVNDGGKSPEAIHRGMEGIVRQTWKDNPETDICFVYTFTVSMLKTLQSGKFPRSASAMEELADHYGIPTIHMGLEAVKLEKEGKLIMKAQKPKTEEEKKKYEGKILFSKDGVHPYPDGGHVLYLAAVKRSMVEIEKAGTVGTHELIKPLREDNWEKAQMIPLSKLKLSSDWKQPDRKGKSQDEKLANRFLSRMPEFWVTRKPGETISFKFKGTTAKVYDLLGPNCGQVIIKVEGQKERTRPLFDHYCTYHRLSTLHVIGPAKEGVYNVTLELDSKQPDKKAIFAKRKKTMKNPEKYNDTAWYAGALLIIGDLVE